MQGWLPRRRCGRQVSPVMELFGAVLFVFVLLLPNAARAHMGWQRLGGEQLAPPKGCVASPMGRAISAPFPCQAENPAKP